MNGRMIVLDHVGGQEAAALLVDGRLNDLLIDDPSAPRPGAIFRAICDRPLKGQGGMMLRLPEGSAFLRQAKGLRPGQPMLVQVTGVTEPGKAVPVTDRVLFKSRYAIVTPGAPGINVSRQIVEEDERDRLLEIAHEAFESSHGLILRSACEGAEAAEIAEDIAEMLALANAVMADAEGADPEALTEGDGPHVLAWRDWVADTVVTDAGGFEREGVLEQIGALAGAEVPLGEGMMFVEPTRALVAVDVNTGPDTSPAAALKANIAAARDLPRQMRLRGLGGQIVIDFAPVPKKDRAVLDQVIRAAFRPEGADVNLAGWTTLGLYEITRRRDRLPLAEVLARGPR